VLSFYCLFVLLLFLFFFFSSRRRHTRSKRDWSSDVCSSDLSLYAIIPHSPLSWSTSSNPLGCVPIDTGLFFNSYQYKSLSLLISSFSSSTILSILFSCS